MLRRLFRRRPRCYICGRRIWWGKGRKLIDLRHAHYRCTAILRAYMSEIVQQRLQGKDDAEALQDALEQLQSPEEKALIEAAALSRAREYLEVTVPDGA